MTVAPPPYVRSADLLSRDDSRLLIVDMQQKLVPTIPVAESLTANCVRLLEAATILGPPAFATEQYPQGLGSTIDELAEHVLQRPAKTRFSCGEVLHWGTAAEPTDPALRDRTKVVVAGIEAHVCVQQTVFDLLAAGFMVYVAADAVASRHQLDWQIALDRMAGGGAVITTTESVLFEWCETASSDEFKQISRLITGC